MLEAEEHRNQHLEKRVKHYQQEIQKHSVTLKNFKDTIQALEG